MPDFGLESEAVPASSGVSYGDSQGWFSSLQNNPDAWLRVLGTLMPKIAPATTALSGMYGMTQADRRADDWAQARIALDAYNRQKAQDPGTPPLSKQILARAMSSAPPSAMEIGTNTMRSMQDYSDASRRALAESARSGASMPRAPQVFPGAASRMGGGNQNISDILVRLLMAMKNQTNTNLGTPGVLGGRVV